jgi:hypothetical protein
MKKGDKARLDDTSHTSYTSLVVRQEVRTPCDRYNSNTDSPRTVSWIEIEVVSRSDPRNNANVYCRLLPNMLLSIISLEKLVHVQYLVFAYTHALQSYQRRECGLPICHKRVEHEDLLLQSVLLFFQAS